jgi:O-antigen/teichoic acid export membrane protein
MKIGQTSLVVFVSKFLGSALGFLSTLYFARVLGAEVLGIYALVMTVVSWLVLFGRLGIGKAMQKRISEGEQQGKYLAATLIWLVSIWVVLSLGLLAGRGYVDGYISEFDEYVALSAAWFVVGIVFVKLFKKTIVFSTLVAERKVHIRGLLEPVSIGARALIQVGLVVLGYGLLGMLVGFIVSSLLVALVGLYWVETRPARPSVRHFRSLFDYAKFSWLGGLQTRAFNNVDIFLLGVFVPTSLVGVYSVSWSIAQFLTLFGQAINATLFPEISYKSSQETKQAVAGMLEDALTFTGLIAIPGLVGGTVLSERLLRLYGDEFTTGTTVLGLLILSTLVYSYQNQLLNVLNGFDRPDLAFRINGVFIGTNVVLNVILIREFGVEGAASATALSTCVGLVLSYYSVSQLIDFRVPFREPALQIGSALFMGCVVWAVLEYFETARPIKNNAVVVVGLVVLGAAVYSVTLFALSSRFRSTVERNLPVDVPYLT